MVLLLRAAAVGDSAPVGVGGESDRMTGGRVGECDGGALELEAAASASHVSVSKKLRDLGRRMSGGRGAILYDEWRGRGPPACGSFWLSGEPRVAPRRANAECERSFFWEDVFLVSEESASDRNSSALKCEELSK